MEYLDYAKKNNLEIDLKNYMDSGVTNQFARFLNGCSINQLQEIYTGINLKTLGVNATHEDYWSGWKNGKCIVYGLNEDYTNIIIENDADNFDAKLIKAQVDYLNLYMTKYVHSYENKGSLYQGVFRLCNKYVKSVSKNKVSTYTELSKQVEKQSSKYALLFIDKYKKTMGKKILSLNTIIMLHCSIGYIYKIQMPIYEKYEKEIIKHLEKFDFYINENSIKKDKIVNIYNYKIRSLLQLDKIDIDKQYKKIPEFDELINALSYDDYNLYISYQNELVNELQQLEKTVFNKEFNILLMQLEAVYKCKFDLINLKHYITGLINNNRTNNTMTDDDISKLAEQLASSLPS